MARIETPTNPPPRFIGCWGRKPAVRMVCALILLCATAAISSVAQTFTTLLSFDGSNGSSPYAGLVQATDGNFYGTTANGGSYSNGVVFRITPKGTFSFSLLYSFCSLSVCDDGANPYSALIQGADGNFYGTTSSNGANGGATIFKITPAGKLTTLYSFCALANCADGEYPMAPLVQAANGTFYGTTWYGGAHGDGTVFAMTPTGKLTTLYSFCSQANCADGELPLSALVEAPNGDFYGTTVQGGANCSYDTGCGTVFEITPAGKLTTLHRFSSGSEGAFPQGGLLRAANGNFYGITTDGGASSACADGCGTVFEITAAGKVTTLYRFCAQTDCPDGQFPEAGLVQGTNGNFYGTTSKGGTNEECNSLYTVGCGTVFEITSAGKLTTIYNFCSKPSCSDGFFPFANLIQSTNGEFYGTNVSGTVFSLGVGLKPFVETLPTFGKTASKVTILGYNLKGSTAVSFNGSAATFKVASATEIKAVVPAGATSGPVLVTSPTWTLRSNVPFRVIP